MKIFSRSLTLTLAAAMFGVGCGATEADSQPQYELSEDEKIAAEMGNLASEQYAQWDAVRKSLVRFTDVTVALAEGYIPVSPCEAQPGTGAMGFHYLNPALAEDLVSDPFKPEVLLYAPDDDGRLMLLGPEYFQADAGQGRPSLYGQAFDGPMPGHNPTMPVHYDLHVWLFKYNPNGLFAPWNPNVKCL